MAAIDLRYARALAAVVTEKNLDVAAAQGQLNDFAGTYADSHDLREVMEDPSIAEAKKLKVLDAIAGRIGMNSTTRNFIAVLSSHGRLHELADIVAAYASLADANSHIAEAEITSAYELDAANRGLLESQIAKLTGGGQVRSTYKQDPALLGGAIVRVGSTIYDGSLRTQLQQVKERLIAAGR